MGVLWREWFTGIPPKVQKDGQRRVGAWPRRLYQRLQMRRQASAADPIVLLLLLLRARTQSRRAVSTTSRF